MRALIQRVSKAEVQIAGEVVGRIDQGLCVFLGVGREDDAGAAAWLADKIVGLRIFEDGEGKMNLSALDVGGSILSIPQFTLYADVARGKRPSFARAMEPGRAEPLFEQFCAACRARGVSVETGRFRAEMHVSLVNHGPVTIWLDTAQRA